MHHSYESMLVMNGTHTTLPIGLSLSQRESVLDINGMYWKIKAALRQPWIVKCLHFKWPERILIFCCKCEMLIVVCFSN